MSERDLQEAVKAKYGAAARQVAAGKSACCGGGAEREGPDPICRNLYDAREEASLPSEALAASLGCGNPAARAELKPGEVVLDLGSGGGIDVLLSARRVEPQGKAFGLDMTEEMLHLARDNQAKAGVRNAEFLLGTIEDIPLSDESVDVILSNCVINLAADKDRVLGEAFRVLKPGGRLAVSDIVIRGPVPVAVRKNMELWVGCLAGALEETEYRQKLQAAGFTSIGIEPTRIYQVEEAREFLVRAGLDPEAVGPQIRDRFMAAFLRAQKPARRSDTSPTSRT